MTNLQFIALLIPALGSILLVILAWMQANSRLGDLRTDTHRQFDGINRSFEGIDRQFEGINRKFEGIERKFEGIERQFEGIDRQFEAVNLRLDSLGKQLLTRASTEQVASLAADFRSFYGMEQKLEGRVDELSKRIA